MSDDDPIIWPPEGEVFTVTFHPAMRDRLLSWLAAQSWELVEMPSHEDGTPEDPKEYVAVLDRTHWS